MSAPFLALLLGLSQGLLHAIGPDHCAAMATLSGLGQRGRRTAFGTALRFALGHALVLGAVAAGCLAAGVGLSEAFERWAEIFGGGVLLALALTALFFPGALAHGHPHLPGHEASHAHQRVSTAAGALMAISGVRSLLVSLPALILGGAFSLEAWTFLPGFALGILAGMGAVGLLFAEGLSRLSERLAEWVYRGVAVSSAALGIVWIAARL